MKRPAGLVACLWFCLCIVSPSTLTVVPVQAQRGIVQQRTVEGKVQDKSGRPIQGATVFLKDTKTLAVKSFLSTEDGSYRIGQLSPTSNYEIWAELNGKKSSTRTISSFDAKNNFSINLKIDK